MQEFSSYKPSSGLRTWPLHLLIMLLYVLAAPAAAVSLHLSSWSILAQVTVHGTFGRYARPSREETAAVLEAGGAKLVPVADALAAGADLAITRADCPRSDPKARHSPHSGQAGGGAGWRAAHAGSRMQGAALAEAWCARPVRTWPVPTSVACTVPAHSMLRRMLRLRPPGPPRKLLLNQTWDD